LPDGSVVTVLDAPVSRLLTVTAAPDTMAPEVSSTVPEMAAVTWDRSGIATADTVSTLRTKLRNSCVGEPGIDPV
jgi:hypothetical protein